eukprot:UN10414
MFDVRLLVLFFCQSEAILSSLLLVFLIVMSNILFLI